jgi:hypothetical protein
MCIELSEDIVLPSEFRLTALSGLFAEEDGGQVLCAEVNCCAVDAGPWVLPDDVDVDRMMGC